MIPSDVIEWIKMIFEDVNRITAEKIHNLPNVSEPSLDMSFIEHLTHFAAPVVLKSGWGIQIDTHYLGGLAHLSRWEIADIGVFLFYSQRGEIKRRKVALLQSKRLYPTNNQVEELERYDYIVGMARIAERDTKMRPLSLSATFDFTEECRYVALKAGDKQQERIQEFVHNTNWPVYYNFYNPPCIPLQVRYPLGGRNVWPSLPPLGQRVIPATPVINLLSGKDEGYSPTVRDMEGLLTGQGDVDFGWRVEDFFADLLVGCIEGRNFDEGDSEALDRLFRRRSGPIAAAIAITIDVVADGRLPD
jgi:hypothetical protein